jgi:hypothetical protein
MTVERKLQIGVWVGTGILLGLAILRWTQARLSDGVLGPYELFPLFGLVAFTLMWSHFVSGTIRRLIGAKEGSLRTFFVVTSWLVLACILIHPVLFIYNLWIDGYGLPPESYLSVYTDITARIALFLGTLSLAAFLLYELRRRYKKALWWRYIEYVNIAAMFAIIYHSLALGGEVSSGWFMILWITYAITLVGAIGYNYYYNQKRRMGS